MQGTRTKPSSDATFSIPSLNRYNTDVQAAQVDQGLRAIQQAYSPDTQPTPQYPPTAAYEHPAVVSTPNALGVNAHQQFAHPVAQPQPSYTEGMVAYQNLNAMVTDMVPFVPSPEYAHPDTTMPGSFYAQHPPQPKIPTVFNDPNRELQDQFDLHGDVNVDPSIWNQDVLQAQPATYEHHHTGIEAPAVQPEYQSPYHEEEYAVHEAYARNEPDGVEVPHTSEAMQRLGEWLAYARMAHMEAWNADRSGE